MREVQLWSLSTLRASEAVCDRHVNVLAEQITGAGVWTHPIAVCRQSRLVMDGNHRLQAAARLKLCRVPVVPLSYNDPSIVVRDRIKGGLFDLARLQAVLTGGALLPYKTTAHEFQPALPAVTIELDALRMGAESPRLALARCRPGKLARRQSSGA